MTGPGVLFLGGASSYSGATTVEAGTLEIGSASAIPAISAVTISSGSTLNLNGVNPTIGSLSGAGSVSLGSGTLTTGNGSSTGFSGVITGTGGLTIQGSGVFELASANTYSGPTVIDAGATVDALNGMLLAKTVPSRLRRVLHSTSAAAQVCSPSISTFTRTLLIPTISSASRL